MRPVHRIDANALLDRLTAVVEAVAGGACIEVRTPATRFFVVPVDRVLQDPGASDPEYGWPAPIELDDIVAVGLIEPGPRKRPILTQGGQPVAMTLTPTEFANSRPAKVSAERGYGLARHCDHCGAEVAPYRLPMSSHSGATEVSSYFCGRCKAHHPAANHDRTCSLCAACRGMIEIRAAYCVFCGARQRSS
ncbi:MAG: hypothetical protein AAF500_21610 [Myxococcota bacterium]